MYTFSVARRIVPAVLVFAITMFGADAGSAQQRGDARSTKSGSTDLRPPNILLIMADDVSWEAFGCYGGEDYRTPNIDLLAAKGVRFEHCYSTPICTTSRVQLMTGKYNFRNYTHFGYLNPEEKTFAQELRHAGYKTAIAGKWQLNGLTNRLPGFRDSQRPHQAGFDEFMLWQLTKGKNRSDGGGERFWSPVFEHNDRLLSSEDTAGQYGPDLLSEFVCEFAERERAEPWMIYYPMVLVHDPFVPTPDTVGSGDRSHAANKPIGKDKKRNFVAMVEYMDKIVGRIVKRLDASGQLDDTLILFTADNGTNVSITSRWNGQSIRGGKASMTDMGTHVPLVAYWKGHTAQGKVSSSLVDFTDFFPTVLDAAQVELDQPTSVDGVSFFPELLSQSSSSSEAAAGSMTQRRKWVLCHYQPYWNKQPGQFARDSRFKLYRDGRLFDIGGGDLQESQPLRLDSLTPTGRVARDALAELLESCPPAPVEIGNKDTVDRPVFSDWPWLDPSELALPTVAK